MSMALSRDLFGIKRETTSRLSFTGTAATALTSCFTGKITVFLALYRRNADWSMTIVRTWKADFSTYERDGDTVSLEFASSSVREEIERNKGTAYEIPLPTDRLLYDGINRDATNQVTGLKGGCYQIGGAPSWLLPGAHSMSEPSSFTFDNYKITCTSTAAITLTITIGRVTIYQDKSSFYSHLYLSKESTSGEIYHFKIFSPVGGSGNYPDFSDSNTYTWTFTMYSGEILYFYFNSPSDPEAVQVIQASALRLNIVSYGAQAFTDYPIQIITAEDVIEALLAKMCITPPTLTYSLTHTYYLPALTSAQGLSQQDDPVINVSFDDVMKMLLCLYGADYELTDDTVTDDTILTIAPAATFLSSTAAETLVSVRGVKTKLQKQHIYGRVTVGYETDEGAKNGTFDPLCKNTFKLGDSENELDLVCPFKASPTTIEQFLLDKNASSSTTKDSDTSVFLFCVAPIVSGQTSLYKTHTFYERPNMYLLNENYYNVPFSPMRMLIANARYLKVSLWDTTNAPVFISTDRTAQMRSIIPATETTEVIEYNGASAALTAGMATPLYKPISVEMSCVMDYWYRTKINTYPRRYFTAMDEKSGITYNFFINDVSLPLTKRETTDFLGLEK
jgi:hypothetical protein